MVLPPIRAKLVRADVREKVCLPPGCTKCDVANCPLHDVLLEDEVLESVTVYQTHRTRTPLNCKSRNVVCLEMQVRSAGPFLARAVFSSYVVVVQ